MKIPLGNVTTSRLAVSREARDRDASRQLREMAMSKGKGNGDEVPAAGKGKLASILTRGRLSDAKEAQDKHADDRKAVERARQARVRARDEREGKR